jgi:hypothetical protein
MLTPSQTDLRCQSLLLRLPRELLMLLSSHSSKTLTTPVDFEGVLHFSVHFSLNIYLTSVRIIALHEAAKTSLVSFFKEMIFVEIHMDSRYDVSRVVHFVPLTQILTPSLDWPSLQILTVHAPLEVGTVPSDAVKSPYLVHEITQGCKVCHFHIFFLILAQHFVRPPTFAFNHQLK